MKKIRREEASKRGFMIDDCTNPPTAYIGARFKPQEWCETFSETEETLLSIIGSLKSGLEAIALCSAEDPREIATETLEILKEMEGI